MATLTPPEVDLIPDFDDPTPEDRAPVHLLRQQAELIERKTGFQVRASVQPSRSGSSTIAYELVLTVPGLGYRHKVLRIEFGLDVWPVTVAVYGSTTPIVAADKPSYIEALASVFRSETFRRIIAGMRALYQDDSVLGATDEAILSIFQRLGIRANGTLPAETLASEISKLPLRLKETADSSLEGLVRRGFLEQENDGYSLTQKGARTIAGAAG
jgi:hypothetical protein